MERAHVERAYRAQYLFAAVFATGVMIPIGYEYGYRKRLRVVETRPADREQPHFDLTQFIAAVHEMKAGVPALNEEGPQKQLALADENRLTCLLRRSNDGRSWTLTAINAIRTNGMRQRSPTWMLSSPPSSRSPRVGGARASHEPTASQSIRAKFACSRVRLRQKPGWSS